jgi:hypothetical protein
MKKIFYFLIRIVSIALLIPAFVIAIPGFILMILADEINPEEYSAEKEIKNNYDGD